MKNKLVSRTELAALLSVHPLTIRTWEKSGRIKPVLYVGLRPRYAIEDIEKMTGETPTVKSKTDGNGK